MVTLIVRPGPGEVPGRAQPLQENHMDNVLEDVQDVRRVKLDPGDLLLVSVRPHTRPEAVEWITEKIREKIPVDVDIMVVTGDIQIAVLTRGQATP